MKVYVIQLLATKSKEKAFEHFRELKKKELPVRIDKVYSWYKVRIGNFNSYKEAQKALKTFNIEGKGYITLIDYVPTRTIAIYTPQPSRKNSISTSLYFHLSVNGKERKSPLMTLQTKEITPSPIIQFQTSLSKNTKNTTPQPQEEKETNTEFLTQTKTSTESEKSFQTEEIRTKVEFKTTAQPQLREEGMDQYLLLFIPILIGSLVLSRLLFRKHNNVEVKTRMLKEERKTNQEKREEVKKTEVATPNKEKGNIFSHGKLIMEGMWSFNGEIASKDAIIVKDGSIIEGTLKSEKFVKLGKNVKCQSIISSIVHTMGNGEIPKIPEAKTAVAGGIKVRGDLELAGNLVIQGNVEVDGRLKIGQGSKIIGNISAKELIVEENTFIAGEISSKNIELKKGVIVGTAPGKGNIKATESVKLSENVVVLGYIKTKRLIST
jgi:cytoskeletal protein CcmA (bactofilin family)